MSGFEVLLFGVLIGLLVAFFRPQLLVVPMTVTQSTQGGGCLLPLVLALLLAALLLFGGKPS